MSGWPLTPIRPTALTPTSTAGPSQEAARLAAQKAFFAMAFGQAQPAVVNAPTAATRTATSVIDAPTPATAAPHKLPRPGSILDIRV